MTRHAHTILNETFCVGPQPTAEQIITELGLEEAKIDCIDCLTELANSQERMAAYWRQRIVELRGPEPCKHPLGRRLSGDEFTADRCLACGEAVYPR